MKKLTMIYVLLFVAGSGITCKASESVSSSSSQISEAVSSDTLENEMFNLILLAYGGGTAEAALINSARELVNRGANINQGRGGAGILLSAAVRLNYKTLCEVLIDEMEADITAQDGAGFTALMGGASDGNKELCELLIVRLLDRKILEERHCCYTFLAILKQFAVPNRRVYSAFDSDITNFINATDINGMTALMHAAKSGDKQTIAFLLEHGAEVDGTDLLGMTALMHAACGLVIQFNRIEACRELLDAGANMGVRDSKGRSALIHAAEFGRDGICALLLSAGAGPLESRHDRSSFTQANGSEDVNSPVHFNALWNRPMSLQLLLDAGYSVDCRDGNGMTPLHLAAQQGDVGCIKILKEYGADLEARDRAGLTPLYYAAALGKKEAVDMLVKMGAQRDLIFTHEPCCHEGLIIKKWFLDGAQDYASLRKLVKEGSQGSSRLMGLIEIEDLRTRITR